MAWEAMHELGEARPVGWIDTETGEVRTREDPPLPDLADPAAVESWLAS